jgi:hypothetical protein
MQKNLIRCLLAAFLLTNYACESNSTRISSITIDTEIVNDSNNTIVDSNNSVSRGTGNLKTDMLTVFRRFDPRDAQFNLEKLPFIVIKPLDINDTQEQVAAQRTVSTFNTIFAKQYDSSANPNWRVLLSHRPISEKKYLIAIESSVASNIHLDIFSVNGYQYNQINTIKIAAQNNYILLDTEQLPEGQYVFRFQNADNIDAETYFYSLVFDNTLNF